MITSYADFKSAACALVISGVNRRLTYRPTKIDTADCPCQFPARIRGDERPLTAYGQGGWPTLTAEIWIVLGPVLQSTNEDNDDASAAMMDAASTTMRGTLPGVLGQSKSTWRIEDGIREIGTTQFWVVILTLTVQG